MKSSEIFTKKKITNLFSWIFCCSIIGISIGCVSAFFLFTLEWATQTRENNKWVIWFLPIGGFMIGLFYHLFGTSVVKGNNLILEELEDPKNTIPIRMAPMVFLGTIISHLFGGSVGREGTAVQMGSTIADQFKNIFKIKSLERRTILITGISAGFASVFGTPLAGAIFALELLNFNKISQKSFISSFLVAFIAYYTVEFSPVTHTHYHIPFIPELNFSNLTSIIISGILFGLAAMIFSKTTFYWTVTFSKIIKYPPLRPLIGGLIIAIIVYFINTTKYIGLGIPTILEAFEYKSDNLDFLMKILFTGFCIGAGFKGGEVTPLFFVGATLGSALSLIIPLPIAVLAGMGFVAVFAGATHTPLACTFMGIELFGYESGLFIGIACFTAYLCSGYYGIYPSQIVRGPKFIIYEMIKKKLLG